MSIPEGVRVVDGAYAMDGGSVHLTLLDEEGARHGLLLTQHRIPRSPGGRPRGRVFFDGEIVGVRSHAERTLISALRSGIIVAEGERAPASTPTSGPHVVVGEDIQRYFDAVRRSPTAGLAHLVAELIEFVMSDAYVDLARTEVEG